MIGNFVRLNVPRREAPDGSPMSAGLATSVSMQPRLTGTVRNRRLDAEESLELRGFGEVAQQVEPEFHFRNGAAILLHNVMQSAKLCGIFWAFSKENWHTAHVQNAQSARIKVAANPAALTL